LLIDIGHLQHAMALSVIRCNMTLKHVEIM